MIKKVKGNNMKKKLVLLFSAAIVIGCMSLPAMAGIYAPDYTKLNTAYHNTHLENQGEMGLITNGSCKFKLAIAKGKNGTPRGEVPHTINSTKPKYSVKYTGWVDQSYKCNYQNEKEAKKKNNNAPKSLYR